MLLCEMHFKCGSINVSLTSMLDMGKVVSGALAGIKMDFHKKLGKVCDALATDTSVYSAMWSWKLGKTRKS